MVDMSAGVQNLPIQGRSSASGPTLFEAIATAFVAMPDLAKRAQEAQRLMALSDAQLAGHGLGRQDVASHVFPDMVDR